MTPREIVTNYYDKVLNRLDQGSSDLDETDCMIYLVVSVQRTIHASDFDAIFEVLLDEEDLMIFIEFLESLDEPELADSFRQAQCILEDAGYRLECEGKAIPADLKAILEPIKNDILSSDGLKGLDDKLAVTIQGI